MNSYKNIYIYIYIIFFSLIKDEQKKTSEIQIALDELVKQYQTKEKEIIEYQNKIKNQEKTIMELTEINEKLQNDLTELENKYKTCLNIYEVCFINSYKFFIDIYLYFFFLHKLVKKN